MKYFEVDRKCAVYERKLLDYDWTIWNWRVKWIEVAPSLDYWKSSIVTWLEVTVALTPVKLNGIYSYFQALPLFLRLYVLKRSSVLCCS